MPSGLEIPFYISYAAAWILIVLQSLVLLGLVRIVYQLQRSGGVNLFAEGREAPAFASTDLSGAPIGTKTFAGHLTGLLFISPTCQGCLETLEEEMQYLKQKARGNVIIVCQSGRAECAQLAEQFELTVPVVADDDNHISEIYGITAVPTVIFINAESRIQSYGHPKREELVSLLEKAGTMEPQGAS